MEYIKRSCKTNRQELLNKALNEELEYLRKKCFPYQRRNFIFDDIEIKEKVFSYEDKERTLGRYEYDSEELKHIIYINKSSIYACQKFSQRWLRRSAYKDLKEIIRHELIHSFVKDRLEHLCKNYIKDKNRDASPIFLTILYWVGGVSNHYCVEAFKKTEQYKNIINFKTYHDLQEYIITQILSYKEYIEPIHIIKNEKDFIAGNTNKMLMQITNDFVFSARKCGFNKQTEIVSHDIYKKDGKYLYKIKSINRTWEVGCNVLPEQITELYNKKQDCKAEYYNYCKKLIVGNDVAAIEDVKNIKQIIVRENKNF